MAEDKIDPRLHEIIHTVDTEVKALIDDLASAFVLGSNLTVQEAGDLSINLVIKSLVKMSKTKESFH